MLEIKKINYQIGKKKLLDDVSILFEPGKVHAILGPNGSGKTTLLKALTFIWAPTSGEVLWNQRRLAALTRIEKSRILTLVPQNPEVPFEFTVEEFVSMGRYAQSSKDCTRLIEWALSETDLLTFRSSSILRLSQGERQRAYIARALATEAPVMLFDEPMASLDVRHQQDIWNILHSLAQQGKTVLVANHDFLNTEKFCDLVHVMCEGKCLAQGSFEEVMSQELLAQVFKV